MLPLTAGQVAEIHALIHDHFASLALELWGRDAVALDDDEVARLVEAGLIDEESAKSLRGEDFGGTALSLGALRAHLFQDLGPDANPLDWSYDKLRKRIEKDPVPLNDDHRRAADLIRRNGAIWCQGLGNTVVHDVNVAIIDHDESLRRMTMGVIRSEAEQAVLERKTAQKMKSELGHATGDWARDWDRIAQTEMSNAYSDGVAAEIAEEYGTDQHVAKVPNPNACPKCRHLCLGRDGRPKILKLSELAANGSNFGRKQSDWKVVIGTIHPNCQCDLQIVPDGLEFDGKWSLVPRKRS